MAMKRPSSKRPPMKRPAKAARSGLAKEGLGMRFLGVLGVERVKDLPGRVKRVVIVAAFKPDCQ